MRCSTLSSTVCFVLAGLPSQDGGGGGLSAPLNGGGDGTAVGALFRILSVQGTEAADANASKESSTTGLKDPDISRNTSAADLSLLACIALSSIAQGLASHGRHGASCLLTSSQQKQRSRLAFLANQASADDSTKQTTPPSNCAGAFLALSSIMILEHGFDCQGGTCWAADVALNLLPSYSTIRNYLKTSSSNTDGAKTGTNKGMLTSWHGIRDGYVGIIEARLRWGGPSAADKACMAGIPLLLVSLLAGGPQDVSDFDEVPEIGQDSIGLSPVGVLWALSAVIHCLPGGGYRDVLFRRAALRTLLNLIGKQHLSHVQSWDGISGGSSGVKDVVQSILLILEFPLNHLQSCPPSPSVSASLSSGLLICSSSSARTLAENEELTKAITGSMPQFWQLLHEVDKD